VLNVLEAFFRFNGDVIEVAVGRGLPQNLVNLVEGSGFSVKLRVLRLIQAICQFSRSDAARTPFLGEPFRELILAAIEDKDAAELHNSALVRLFRDDDERGAPYREIILMNKTGDCIHC
jgi:hypothetical protein